jgi:Uma2 family endonuclease
MFTIPKPQRGNCFRLSGVPWPTYTRLLRIFANSSGVRLTYDRGELEIMSPGFQHDNFAGTLDHFILVLAEELGLPLQWGGSVTMRRRSLRRGLEADRTYWIAHEVQVRSITRLDLRIHPPPDLAVEVEVSRSILNRLAILARLRVPELWRLSERGLRFQQLQADGTYADISHSLSFPQFTAADIEPFLALAATTEKVALIAQFRQWVRQRLAPPSVP